jgi:hypothetical protein
MLHSFARCRSEEEEALTLVTFLLKPCVHFVSCYKTNGERASEKEEFNGIKGSGSCYKLKKRLIYECMIVRGEGKGELKLKCKKEFSRSLAL